MSIAKELTIKVDVDTTNLDNAIEKARELANLLDEIKGLSDELATRAFLNWILPGATPNEIRQKLGLDIIVNHTPPEFIRKHINLGEAFNEGLQMGIDSAVIKKASNEE